MRFQVLRHILLMPTSRGRTSQTWGNQQSPLQWWWNPSRSSTFLELSQSLLVISPLFFGPFHVLMTLRLYSCTANSEAWQFPQNWYKRHFSILLDNNVIGSYFSICSISLKVAQYISNPTAASLGTCRRLIRFRRQRSGHGETGDTSAREAAGHGNGQN